MKKLVPILLAVALFAGCGGSDGNSDATWTEAQVVDAAKLTPSADGISYTTPEGCDVALVLTTKQEVDLYSGAGDTVAANPSGTAGYKIVGGEQSCVTDGEVRLAALD